MDYVTMIITGTATGIGSALGTYFGQKHIIKTYEKILESIKKKD